MNWKFDIYVSHFESRCIVFLWQVSLSFIKLFNFSCMPNESSFFVLSNDIEKCIKIFFFRMVRSTAFVCVYTIIKGTHVTIAILWYYGSSGSIWISCQSLALSKLYNWYYFIEFNFCVRYLTKEHNFKAVKNCSFSLI